MAEKEAEERRIKAKAQKEAEDARILAMTKAKQIKEEEERAARSAPKTKLPDGSKAVDPLEVGFAKSQVSKLQLESTQLTGNEIVTPRTDARNVETARQIPSLASPDMMKRIESKLAREARERQEVERWMQEELETRDKLLAEIARQKAVLGLLDQDLADKLHTHVDNSLLQKELEKKTEEGNRLQNQIVLAISQRKQDEQKIEELKETIKQMKLERHREVVTQGDEPATDAPGLKAGSSTTAATGAPVPRSMAVTLMLIVAMFSVIRQLMGLVVTTTMGGTGADDL